VVHLQVLVVLLIVSGKNSEYHRVAGRVDPRAGADIVTYRRVPSQSVPDYPAHIGNSLTELFWLIRFSFVIAQIKEWFDEPEDTTLCMDTGRSATSVSEMTNQGVRQGMRYVSSPCHFCIDAATTIGRFS
jgi:hypothetical protein